MIIPTLCAVPSGSGGHNASDSVICQLTISESAANCETADPPFWPPLSYLWLSSIPLYIPRHVFASLSLEQKKSALSVCSALRRVCESGFSLRLTAHPTPTLKCQLRIGCEFLLVAHPSSLPSLSMSFAAFCFRSWGAFQFWTQKPVA